MPRWPFSSAPRSVRRLMLQKANDASASCTWNSSSRNYSVDHEMWMPPCARKQDRTQPSGIG
jgi:hypothetical protein